MQPNPRRIADDEVEPAGGLHVGEVRGKAKRQGSATAKQSFLRPVVARRETEHIAPLAFAPDGSAARTEQIAPS